MGGMFLRYFLVDIEIKQQENSSRDGEKNSRYVEISRKTQVKALLITNHKSRCDTSSDSKFVLHSVRIS
jgi:hypothetical protein